ncbi:type VI secretion system-associated FHA domain protein TagH [Novosphingobium sp.]|uniref:type VI secretion system-associated FHA domain protein TagH n=1 Tax=Novosphingobium sp. TaxID=1874826 RepID=UPI0027345CF6|nr:type VI secretion system-associated FHA domain protein TagH [Novosphingobium sp.]MDP3908221.1 type VI secretion system-associated FHA domain protein TagH [Novosphingobium sp.]
MTLVLSLKNVPALSNGGPLRLELERRGAAIGRSPTVDWTLPDPSNFISSRHCEVRFEGDSYLLRDTSTNGTLINGAAMSGPHRLASGDVIVIGQYEVEVAVPGQVAAAPGTAGPEWQGWDTIGAPTGDSAAGKDWGKPKPVSALAGGGPVGGNWAPPPMAQTPVAASPVAPAPAAPPIGESPPVAGGNWGAPSAAAPPPPPATPPPAADLPWGAPTPGADWAAPKASDWSSQAATPPPTPAGKDIWGQMAEVNAVDWSRSNFGAVEPPSATAPLGLAGTSGAEALGNLPPVDNSFGLAPPAPAEPAAPAGGFGAPPAAAPVAPPAPAQMADLNAQLAAMLGLSPADLRQESQATLAAMATMLRSLLSGMVVMVEARARAKAQLGAQATILQFEGNNPLKFARTPEQSMAQMLNPAERGFMPAERAIEDAFVDLQSHQMATLKAMQGALRATLDRFSPKAISQRVQSKGLLSQILPGAQDAALWRAYVKEFSGVSEGSDEAFMEVFAREFRKAYEEESAQRSR